MATHSSTLAWRIPMNRGAWQATARGVAKSRIGLSNKEQHNPKPTHLLSQLHCFFHTESAVKTLDCVSTHPSAS